MSLQKFIESLSEENQFRLAIKLAKRALPIWNKFADKTELSYRDSVAGLKHTVDKSLLKDALESVENYLKNKRSDFSEEETNLYKKFIDPIVALQDDDWELPDEVLKTFYSVYILIEALIDNEKPVFGNSSLYVSINHSIDALVYSKTLSTDEINGILDSFKP
jgi:hypothetical protein